MTDLDLTPAVLDERPPRRWRNWLIFGVLGSAAVFVLYQALTDARVFFLNVDEAVAQRADLGDEMFRMQGTVVDEPSTGSDGALVFTVSFGGEEAQVRHIGDEPSDLFQLGQPVVAEGRWAGRVFESSQVVVKHSEEYVEDNPDRVDYEVDPLVEGDSTNGDGPAGDRDQADEADRVDPTDGADPSAAGEG